MGHGGAATEEVETTADLKRPVLPWASNIAFLSFMLCCVFFVWAAGKTFGFGDDANFLIMLSAPDAGHASTTEFAYVWRPLYLLLDGSVEGIRLGGALALEACALLFGLALTRLLPNELDRVTRASVICLAGTTVLWQYWLWIPTPDYNKLNLCGILLFLSAILFSAPGRMHAPRQVRRNPSEEVGTAILAGIGLGVIGLAKPPTLVLVIALGLVWLFTTGVTRPYARLLIAAGSAMLVIVISALLIDGSISAFVARLSAGMSYLKVRSSHGTGLGIVTSVFGPLYPDRIWKIPPVMALGAATFVAVYFWARQFKDSKVRDLKVILTTVALSAVLGAIVAVSRSMDAGNLDYFPLNHLWYLTPPLALSAAVIAFWDKLKPVRRAPLDRNLAAIVITSLTPVAYAFGTNTTLVRQTSGAVVFWFAALALAGNALPVDGSRLYLRAVAAFGGILTLCLLVGVAVSPNTGLEPLWAQETSIEVGPQSALVEVDVETARYIETLRASTHSNGFSEGTAILDFGSAGPGLAFALGAASSTYPWLTFGKSSDAATASYILRGEAPGVLQRAWVLTSPGRTERVAHDTLRELGLTFPQNYAPVAHVQIASRGLEHVLWKPRRSGQR